MADKDPETGCKCGDEHEDEGVCMMPPQSSAKASKSDEGKDSKAHSDKATAKSHSTALIPRPPTPKGHCEIA